MADLTRKALASSLKELLEEKPFSKITISDITTRAGLIRQTFYYHFRDIYDLVQWMLSEEVRMGLEKIDCRYISLSDTLELFYTALNRNKKLIYAIYRFYDSKRSRQLVKELFCPYCKKILEVRPYYDRLDDSAKDFILTMFLSAITSIITSWLDGEGDISESKKIAFFVTIFDSSINDFITTCLDKNQKLKLD